MSKPAALGPPHAQLDELPNVVQAGTRCTGQRAATNTNTTGTVIETDGGARLVSMS